MAVNTFSDHLAQRRRFIAIQAAKAALGAVLGLAFFGMVGRPDAAEAIAMAGLMAPAILALLGLTRIPLAALEQASLASFAVLIAYLAVLTGGVVSPLTVWFALVPAEAALAGASNNSRSAVTRAGIAAALAFAVVVAIEAMGALPPSRLTLPLWQVTACSMLAALVQAVLIAAAAQDRQRAADAAAAQGAAMYRFLADNAMDLITRHASDGRIRFASPATLALLGRAPEEITGETMVSLTHPDDFDAAQAALVEASDAALDASRAKSRFLANMSHELRTPLNAIIGFSEMMTREMFGSIGPRYQEYSRLIHESGAHLLELINSVLDMSKIEAGKFKLHEEMFDLDETAQSAVRFLKIPAERAGVALKLAIAPDVRQIFADRRAVKQILVNLLSNGVKYTPPGGEVRVTARLLAEPGRGVEIRVSDTGTGISKPDLERLGRPFEQVENAQTRAKEGTGLGLALVKSLAQLHGGEAVLQSVLGEGTTVTVRLPHAAVDAKGKRVSEAKILPFRAAS